MMIIFALTLPLPDDYILQTDACGSAISAVLSVRTQATEHPVTYFSQKLSDAERKYGTTAVEAPAVVKAIKHFAIYLTVSTP